MRRAENHHDDRSRKVMQPDSDTQEIQHREHRQRHRDKEKRMAQQEDLLATHKIGSGNCIHLVFSLMWSSAVFSSRFIRSRVSLHPLPVRVL